MEIADLTYVEHLHHGNFFSYKMKGTIKYIENNENFAINFLYCSHFHSENESFKKSYITLSDHFIDSNGSFKYSIFSSDITNFVSTHNALERDSQYLDEVHQLNDGDPTSTKTVVKLPVKNKRASYQTSQESSTKKMKLKSDEQTGELSSGREIASQSSVAEAGRSNPLTKGFDREVENSDDREFTNISVGFIKEIKEIIKNLDDNQSIELIPSSGVSKEVAYTKIIINYCTTSYRKKSYNITLFDNKGGEITHIDHLIDVFSEDNELKLKLSPRYIKQPTIYINNVVGIIVTHIKVPIENYDLSIITLQPDHQIISDLNKKYGKNFVAIIDNIKIDNTERIKGLVRDLNNDNRLVFINSRRSRINKNKKIEIIKKDRKYRKERNSKVDYYDIYIESDEGEETIENEPISVGSDGRTINLRTSFYKEGERIKKSFTVNNFRLYTSIDATN